MSQLVDDCPRCGAQRITFDVKEENFLGTEYGWRRLYEAFCVCRHCERATIFKVAQKSSEDSNAIGNLGLLRIPGAINTYYNVLSYISIKDGATLSPPEHLPLPISTAFAEGAKCLSVGCFNASATMFRLCIDIATCMMLPEADEDGLTAKIRRSLGLRLQWLLDQKLLPEALRELASCIKEDGNDGAHAGTLGKEDAEDILDFTVALLERMFTEPERLRLAKERRDARRGSVK